MRRRPRPAWSLARCWPTAILAVSLCACGASVQHLVPPLLQPPDDYKGTLADTDQRYQVELTYTALAWASTNTPRHPIVYTPRDPSQLVGVPVEVRTAQTLTKRLRLDLDFEPAPVGDFTLTCDDQAGTQICHYAPYQALVSPEGQSISETTGHLRLRISYNASPAEIAAAAASTATSAQASGRRGIIEKEYCLTLTRPRVVQQAPPGVVILGAPVADWTVTNAALVTPTAPLSSGPCARLGR